MTGSAALRLSASPGLISFGDERAVACVGDTCGLESERDPAEMTLS